MNKVFVFILLIFLSGCYTPEEHYSVHIGNKNSALVKTPTNGWGIGTGLKTVEHAVYSAFRTCESFNPNEYCALKKINGRNVGTSEAQEWKDRYSRNAQFVTFSKRDGGWYVLRLYPWNGTSTNGFSVTSTSTRTNDKDVSKFNIE